VSVDVAYQNKRYGLKHLSITLHDEGQIQEIGEAQAGFRLARRERRTRSALSSPPPAKLRPISSARVLARLIFESLLHVWND
jgi:hypothetical protein